MELYFPYFLNEVKVSFCDEKITSVLELTTITRNFSLSFFIFLQQADSDKLTETTKKMSNVQLE